MQKYGLTTKQQQIVTLASLGTLTQREIAKRVGCHFNTVLRVLKSPQGSAMLSEIRGTVQEKVIEDLSAEVGKAATKAFNRLLDLMQNASSAAVQFRAIESILDRSSVAPKKVLHSKHEVDQRIMRVTIGGAEIRRMHKVFLESTDNPEGVPSLPELNERGEYVFDVDPRTGEILREGE